MAEGWFEGMIASPSLSISAEKLLLFLVLRGVVPFLDVFFESFFVLEAGRGFLELVMGAEGGGLMCFEFCVQESSDVAEGRGG